MPEMGWWFPGRTETGHVQAAAVSSTITAALKQAGSTATAHQLRDTAATRLQRTVKDIRLTQAMLRHSNLNTTMKYCAASNDDLQQAVKSLDWADEAGQRSSTAAQIDLGAMPPDELQALAAQLLTALAKHETTAGI